MTSGRQPKISWKQTFSTFGQKLTLVWVDIKRASIRTISICFNLFDHKNSLSTQFHGWNDKRNTRRGHCIKSGIFLWLKLTSLSTARPVSGVTYLAMRIMHRLQQNDKKQRWLARIVNGSHSEARTRPETETYFWSPVAKFTEWVKICTTAGYRWRIKVNTKNSQLIFLSKI